MQNTLDLLTLKNIVAKKVAGTKGGEYHSPCPGCGGDDRFHVWPQQNSGQGSYWCRGCGRAGDNIQFLIDFDGLTYPEACKRLDITPRTSEPYQTPKLPPSSKKTNWAPTPSKPPPSDLWKEKAQKLVDWSHEELFKNSTQLRYLKSRGLSKEIIEKYRLGWNPGSKDKDLFRPRESWGLPTEMKNGRKKKLWIPRGIVIPYLQDDQVLRIRIRRPEGEPRFYVLPGSQMTCMVKNQVNRAFIIVESELDGILLDQQAGDIISIVALGASGAKPDAETTRLLRSAALILLSQDYDDAGAKSLSWWLDEFPQAIRWPVPIKGDPGEAHEAGIDLRMWVQSGFPKGWIIGQTLLDSKNQRKPAQKPSADSDIPGSVLELTKLLKSHPVAIHVTSRRTHIQESMSWAYQNWSISQRISNLVYFNQEVFEYLQAHSDEIITGKNIIKESLARRHETNICMV